MFKEEIPAVDKKVPEPVEEKKIEKKAEVKPKAEPKKDEKKEEKKEVKKEAKKEERKMPAEESSEKEKRDLHEADEKIRELTAGIKLDKKPALAQLATASAKQEKDSAKGKETGEYDQEPFE